MSVISHFVKEVCLCFLHSAFKAPKEIVMLAKHQVIYSIFYLKCFSYKAIMLTVDVLEVKKRDQRKDKLSIFPTA